MADDTLDHLDHDALFLCHLEPSIFADRLSPYHGSPPTTSFFNPNRSTPPPRFGNIRRSSSIGSQDLLRIQTNNHQTHAPNPRISRLSAFLQEMENDDGQEELLNNQLNEQRTLNGRLLASVSNSDRVNTNRLSSKGQAHRAGMVKGRYFLCFTRSRFNNNNWMLIHELSLNPAASTGAPMRQPRYRHTFYRQPSCTFSYYGRVGSHRYRYRRANAALLIKPSRSMNDLHEVETRHRRRRSRQRNRHRSGNTNSSSGDTESEEGEVSVYLSGFTFRTSVESLFGTLSSDLVVSLQVETTVRLLWLSMLKMPRELLRLCACHLLTWFSIIAEAVFFTDFMGQVIYHGDPTVRESDRHRYISQHCPSVQLP